MAAGTIGQYRVERLIKRGGMGAVYLGVDPDLKRRAAIKLLRDDLDGDDARERFRREAMAIAALDHPNVIRIFHYGFDDDRPYIAMEFVEGETLGELIRRGAGLALERKLQIVEDVCCGLGAAHRAGIVHRDIKPANILVAHGGAVKVIDFGIARTPDTTLTQLGALVGTLDYMAPEQFNDCGVDDRTDIFAVGVLLYELITRMRPFAGDSGATLASRVRQRDPLSLSSVCPEIAPDIAAIVGKALEYDPDRRYQNVEALREALTAARRGSSAIGDETLVSPRGRTTPPTPVPPLGDARAFTWRRAAIVGSAGLALLAVAVGIDRVLSSVDTPALPPVEAPAPPPRGASLPSIVAVAHIPAPPRAAATPAPPTPAATPVRSPAPAPTPAPERPKAPSPPPSPGAPAPRDVIAVPSEPGVSPQVAAPAPPPPPAPAAVPAAPPPASIFAPGARQLVREAVERYMQAMSNRDIAAIAAVRPLDTEVQRAMEANFAALRSWRVTLADPFVTVSMDATSARVTGKMKYENVRSLDGRQGRVKDQNVTIMLRRTAGGWQITDISVSS
jgi:serine/threonine-protein kinase